MVTNDLCKTMNRRSKAVSEPLAIKAVITRVDYRVYSVQCTRHTTMGNKVVLGSGSNVWCKSNCVLLETLVYLNTLASHNVMLFSFHNCLECLDKKKIQTNGMIYRYRQCYGRIRINATYIVFKSWIMLLWFPVTITLEMLVKFQITHEAISIPCRRFTYLWEVGCTVI